MILHVNNVFLSIYTLKCLEIIEHFYSFTPKNNLTGIFSFLVKLRSPLKHAVPFSVVKTVLLKSHSTFAVHNPHWKKQKRHLLDSTTN